MHQHKHFRLSRNDFIFFLLAVFRVNLIPTSFSLVFTVVRVERVALYIGAAFLLPRLHACAIQVNHTLRSSIVRISFLL